MVEDLFYTMVLVLYNEFHLLESPGPVLCSTNKIQNNKDWVEIPFVWDYGEEKVSCIEVHANDECSSGGLVV